MSRRSFLGRSASGLAWMGLAGSLEGLHGLLRRAAAGSSGSADETVVTILHTNDVHSRIDPFPEGSGRNAGLAGAARRATLIKQIRANNPRTLLLDAGDVFQGTPYFNLFKGEVDFKVMNSLGYDAMTIGNHEFDCGLEGLASVLRLARFKVVSANYDFSRTLLRDRVHPYIIRELGDVRVGIFGLGVILEGLVPESLCRGVVYSNPIPVARKVARYLREEERCHLVVCLSHLGNNGYQGEPGEQQIAKEVEGIDFIIGGHSHTFMREPTRIRHGSRETLVFQVGWAGIYLGRVDFLMRAGEVVATHACTIPVGTVEVVETQACTIPVGTVQEARIQTA
ncbi:MAG: metallophosphatase [Candidatus Eisenbacteria sp.]|nr:metallophosphatase [Candidatus Eisenbacteria bacterium]